MSPKEAILQATDLIYGQNLDSKMAASRLNVACQTLANWRSKRKGPPYCKMSGGKIVYRLVDLDNYLQKTRIDPEARE